MDARPHTSDVAPRPHGRARLPRRVPLLLAIALTIACVAGQLTRTPRHGWWDGLGAVVPHDSFPADCSLCHVGGDWNRLRADFAFDHGARTGVALDGAHDRAQCLRCHNDRGPVEAFAAQGCAGCHADVHAARLGPDCTRCHTETTWQPRDRTGFHDRTRFPLIGVHAVTSCRRCHEGGEVGAFLPTPTDCVSCHREDLLRTQDPDHLALGFVDRCDRCHRPTSWDEAEFP